MNYLIACVLLVISSFLYCCNSNTTKEKEKEIELKPKELVLKEKELNLRGKDSAKTSTNLVDTIKTKLSQKTPTQQLRLTPLNISGEIGHVTFSQKGKTIFYYDAQTKRGKIILNGSEYILTKIEGSYKLSGNNVNITTTKGKWKEMESDCAYGKALVVTIKMGSQALQLNNVEVQDCQSMVE